MAAPTVVAFALTAFDQDQTDTNCVVDISGLSLQDGDLLYAFVACGATETPNTHASFTSDGLDGGVGTAGIQHGAKTMWRAVTNAAGEPSSYTFTVTTAAQSIGAGIIQIRGADTSDPIDVLAETPGSAGGNAVCPDVSTTVADTLILRFFSLDSAGPTTQDSAPASHTPLWARGPSTGAAGNVGFGAAYTTQAAAGAVGTATWANTNNDWWAGTIAIKPTAGGPVYAQTDYRFYNDDGTGLGEPA